MFLGSLLKEKVLEGHRVLLKCRGKAEETKNLPCTLQGSKHEGENTTYCNFYLKYTYLEMGHQIRKHIINVKGQC